MTSTLIKNQTKEWRKTFFEEGKEYLIIATARYDDDCRNGHNSFGLTGVIWRAKDGRKRGSDCESCGCLHEDIVTHFPELAPLIQWHLTSADGPMHYIANTEYWVGLRGYCDGKAGSPPNLDFARSAAVWPEATDEDLTAPGLKARLEARLPGLLTEFQAAMEGLGFTY